MLESTFLKFAEVEKGAKSIEKPLTSLSFRAYHSPLGKLVITKRLR